MKTLLVPVDLSSAGATVCTAACDLAKAVSGKLVLLHVVKPPPVVVSEIYAVGPGDEQEMLALANAAGDKRLKALAAKCAQRRVAVRAVKEAGLPVEAILRHARKADYIVMGSHGHGAVYDLLVGSTTHGVLRKARCPVIVVPPGKRR